MSSDLWNFALRFYARPGVEQTCLQLQNTGADVCLLLCACWLQQSAHGYSAQRCAQLQTLAQPWQQQVITPLRQLRQNWRAAAQQQSELALLREQLKVLEQQAERQLLDQLEACALAWPALTSAENGDWLSQLSGGAGALDALQWLRAEVNQT
ncbi:MAG: TIGR02444 family protein [Pseudomonadaceae bacterium]|jgi:uncharacterized protein (TIGR02444 family)|nr:TIGR02444 family protein [Pseudomonadaceae bacterium]